MKIKVIFDSEGEKHEFIAGTCPFIRGDEGMYYDCPFPARMYGNKKDCQKCWETSGIEMEVRDGSRES